jgi:hypothetical protein
MTWYHVFLTYRDTDGAICHLIQYDIAPVSTLHSELLVPLQAQRPLSLDGHVIPGIPAIQRLQIFQSACPFAELQLPDGSSALDHSPDTVRFLFDRGIVEEVKLYTPPILIPFLRTVAASSRDRGDADPHRTGAKSHPPVRAVSVYPTVWLYYVLCGYAALGNTILTGLVRWVETGLHPTALGALLRHDALARTWPMMTSMLVGLGLLGMYYLVLLVRGSRRLLTLMNSSLLAVIVATNLINLFMTSLEEQVSSGTLLMYVVPYLLLLGIVAGISFTFATPQLPNRRSDRGGPEPVSWHRPYRIAYPLWFSYLFGGIVLWAVILRSQRHLVRRREGRVVHKAPSAATSDLSLPSLPPLDIQGAESLAMPLLPDLEN